MFFWIPFIISLSYTSAGSTLFWLFHVFMLLLWIWTGRLTATPGKWWPQSYAFEFVALSVRMSVRPTFTLQKLASWQVILPVCFSFCCALCSLPPYIPVFFVNNLSAYWFVPEKLPYCWCVHHQVLQTTEQLSQCDKSFQQVWPMKHNRKYLFQISKTNTC